MRHECFECKRPVNVSPIAIRVVVTQDGKERELCVPCWTGVKQKATRR